MDILQYEVYSEQGRDWSEAFARAVDDLDKLGGGVLTVPAGIYSTGSIVLKSHMTLSLAEGAVLRFLQSAEAFPPVELEFEGIPGLIHRSCIFARGCEDIRITGKGTLDGGGAYWWREKKEGRLRYPRPYLVCFDECENVMLEGITLTNSPCWTVHPLRCENVTLKDLTIENPYDSPNTDGIDPDSCRNVWIENCTINVGDDCIAIKSGTEDTVKKRPCKHIVIRKCAFLHGHGGVVIGSEMSGDVRDVRVEDCFFSDTDRGVRLKTRRGRGGMVENICLSDLRMERIMCPFVFNMYYFCGKDGKLQRVWDKAAYPVDETTPTLRHVVIENVKVEKCTSCAAFFWGLTENPVQGIIFRHVDVTMDENGAENTPAMMDHCPRFRQAGLFLRSARDVVFDHVTVANVRGKLWDTDDTVSIIEKA